jgi:hypothetical protein
MKAKLTKYWAEISAAGVAVYHFLSPSLQAYAAAHPKSTVSALLAGAVLMGLKKSPLGQ